jgi:uncharacterized damage-inducible protein DinB
MKTEFVEQYGHTWRVFERLVKGFDQDAWIHTGRGTTTPARIAFHILQAVRYYLEDSTTVLFASGKSFKGDSWAIVEEDLPSQNDILVCIGEFKVKTEKWLSEMDFGSKNESFEWAGETRLGVALFLLRHSIYHMGELSSLLNESRKGNAEDNYVKAI